MHRTAPRFALTALAALAISACGDNLTDPLAYGDYEPPPEVPLACIPNLDGQIEAHELAPTLGIAATFLVSPALPVDTTAGRLVDVVGSVNNEGRRVWDWSATEPSDQIARLTGRPLADQWYAGHFPAGEFVLAVDAGETRFGVYSHDETALMLHGWASVAGEPLEARTLLVFEEPIAFFEFPLTVGQEWTATAKVRDGTLQGLTPWSQNEVYVNRVETAGELRLPDFTFTQALRINTIATIQPLAVGETASVRQVSFVFECFGEIARASSTVFLDHDEDPGADFTIAAEIRRLGWF